MGRGHLWVREAMEGTPTGASQARLEGQLPPGRNRPVRDPLQEGPCPWNQADSGSQSTSWSRVAPWPMASLALDAPETTK